MGLALWTEGTGIPSQSVGTPCSSTQPVTSRCRSDLGETERLAVGRWGEELAFEYLQAEAAAAAEPPTVVRRSL